MVSLVAWTECYLQNNFMGFASPLFMMQSHFTCKEQWMPLASNDSEASQSSSVVCGTTRSLLWLVIPSPYFHCVCCVLSPVWLLLTPWTVAHQAPLSMGFPRQEYWSGLPFPPPGDLPDPGIEPSLLHCRQILYPLSHLGNLPWREASGNFQARQKWWNRTDAILSQN